MINRYIVRPKVTNDLYMKRALGVLSNTYQYPKNVRKEVGKS